MNPNYKEFSDPRLVAVYDALNPLGADSGFFCDQMAALGAKSAIDLGCGTGLLTCELARRGWAVTGIEPASAMLAIAKAKFGAERVRWVEGSYEQMTGLRADAVIMSSHVAQFFLEDREWHDMLRAARRALSPGGHIMFDARNPRVMPWQDWTRAKSIRSVCTPSGLVRMWYQLLTERENRVRYEIHYQFDETGAELISVNELIYRTHEQIIRSLQDAGFSGGAIYGDWHGKKFVSEDREMVFVIPRGS